MRKDKGMDSQEILNIYNRLIRWQSCGLVHQLTCGNNSQHKPLKPVIIESKVILVCLDCDWRQDVPDMFYNDDVDTFLNNQEQLYETLYKNFTKEY